MTIQDLEGRLSAMELITTQTLAFIFVGARDIDGTIEEMRNQLVRRQNRLSPEAFQRAIDSFDSLTSAAAETAKAMRTVRDEPGEIGGN